MGIARDKTFTDMHGADVPSSSPWRFYAAQALTIIYSHNS